MLSKYLYSVVVLLIFTSCKILQPVKINTIPTKKSKTTISEWRNWQHKDIIEDTIPGISLDKAYRELLKRKSTDTIIVALLDNRIDSEHEDIKDFIWINNNEIPNNKLDDDNNGYVDDVNGWNFLGNSEGVNVDRANFETTRIVRKYQANFKSKKIDEIPSSLKEEYILYTEAKKMYDESIKNVKESLAFLQSADDEKEKLYVDLSKIYNDSLLIQENIKNLTSNDSLVNLKIEKYRNYLNYVDWSINSRKNQNRYLEIYLGLDYEERSIIADDVDDINDTGYGNGNITANRTSTHNHAIKVAGVLAANRENNKGIKGISNLLMIMPVAISPTGDEQDKDIALGIRYAVDNGAKIIIMTFTKFIVQHEDWLSDAIKYASDNDVLIVLASGNSATDSDVKKTFPNDYDANNIEYVNNVIVTGGIRNSLNNEFATEFSCYGKNNVDIFAPARSIFTTLRNNEYGYETGTSVSAPIVAGVAALIRSYYPNLSASEVKQIIMESGVSYDIMVNKPSTSEEKELVPFSSLSKSGKIVNAYNALLMAEEVSKKKKKRKK